ncbi:(2Fe-2S)-binding protein [Kaistia adipata]|uniref:(2Fe-2S)-binding protein n=1 Tax=Kaistia adipata TaxID=166954 RepID=UPI000428CE6B|nr:(2Fe-2S)-binding protein [Kaistia adipata]
MPQPARIEPAADLVVIGAGPAGMAAAVEARRHGLAVTVLDDQPAAGGQILRGIARRHHIRYEPWGQPLADAFATSGARHVAGAAVWARDGDAILFGQEGRTCRIRARATLVATGSMERPVVVPGNTLPGVVTVGALQSFLKGSGAVPDGPFVLAGCGPLLLLTALQLATAGAPPTAIVDTMPRGRWRAAMAGAAGLLGDMPLALKGISLIARVRLAGIPVHRHATELRVLGTDRAEGLAFRADGENRTIAAGLVALHDGVVPHDQLAVSLGCESRFDPALGSYRMVTDADGRSSLPDVWIAGDGAAIAGGYLATLSGSLAALDVARSAGRIDAAEHARLATPLAAERRRRLRARAFVDALYAPTLSAAAAPDAALLCRCEEVTVGQARAAIAAGARGTRQLKAATRCGMGPCQGRQCTLSVVNLLARELGDGADLVRPSLRTPGRPVTVAELAASHEGHGHTGSDA